MIPFPSPSRFLQEPVNWLLRHRILGLGVLSLAMGLLAVWGVQSHVRDFLAAERERLTPRVKTIEVVVAKRNLKPGDPVDADTMALRQVPETFAASQAVREDGFKALQGLRLTQALMAGETLLPIMLAGADAGSFLAKIKPGIRALTIQVDEVNAVSGMLQPGDRIDLLMSARVPAGSAPLPGAPLPGAVMSAVPPADRTVPLLQDVLVLATGRQVRPSGSDESGARPFNAITVEVSPDQAQKLVVAQRAGKLTALLRNPSDRREALSKGLDVQELLGMRSEARPRPASIAPPVQQEATEIIVGGRGALQAVAPAASALPAPPAPPATSAAAAHPGAVTPPGAIPATGGPAGDSDPSRRSALASNPVTAARAPLQGPVPSATDLRTTP